MSRDPTTVLTQLASFLAAQERIANECEAGHFPISQAIQHYGVRFFKMNPTLVHVEVIDAGKGTCTLLVSGAAKEGLIKQRSAEKAVNRVVEFLGTIS